MNRAERLRHYWAVRPSLAAIFLACLPMSAAATDDVALVVDGAIPAPAQLALSDLEQALKGRKIDAVRRKSLPNNGRALVIGVAGSSSLVDRFLASNKID